MHRRWILFTVLGLCLPLSGLAVGEEKAATRPAATTRPVSVQPKAISEHVLKGLDFLASKQLEVGAWGQGEESARMSQTGKLDIKDTPNVADTCIATLAFLHSGNTPREGKYKANVRAAVDFVCREIAQSEEGTLFITTNRSTRTQTKLGPYIDTFMAALLLSEVKDKMPDEAGQKQVTKALAKVMGKIEKNQKEDGTWDNRGWAPALSQAIATKALNRASQTGHAVDETVRARAETYAQGQFKAAPSAGPAGGAITSGFSSAGSAGVELYAAANAVGSLQDSENTNSLRKGDLVTDLARATTQPQREKIQKELARIDKNTSDLSNAKAALVRRLGDKQFVSGFGSNGGEEFLSYMNIGESLVASGGAEWEKWDKSTTDNLNRIQNSDGSWSGDHCITGRTFCTSAALMVLMVDRTPSPIAGKISQKFSAAR